jgi:hypothetical protein
MCTRGNVDDESMREEDLSFSRVSRSCFLLLQGFCSYDYGIRRRKKGGGGGGGDDDALPLFMLAISIAIA